MLEKRGGYATQKYFMWTKRSRASHNMNNQKKKNKKKSEAEKNEM